MAGAHETMRVPIEYALAKWAPRLKHFIIEEENDGAASTATVRMVSMQRATWGALDQNDVVLTVSRRGKAYGGLVTVRAERATVRVADMARVDLLDRGKCILVTYTDRGSNQSLFMWFGDRSTATVAYTSLLMALNVACSYVGLPVSAATSVQ